MSLQDTYSIDIFATQIYITKGPEFVVELGRDSYSFREFDSPFIRFSGFTAQGSDIDLNVSVNTIEKAECSGYIIEGTIKQTESATWAIIHFNPDTQSGACNTVGLLIEGTIND